MSPTDSAGSAPVRVTTIEELQSFVGKELGVGPWLTMTQERINSFADATGDRQWIHVDPKRCKTSGFDETIAHGYLTLSLITLLREKMDGVEVALNTKMGINYGSDRVRFIAPVRTGRRIRLRTSLLELKQVEPLVWQAKYRHTIEIENEARPAVIADTLNRIVLNQ
ncbi:MAG: MaoC family dehydratase [Alphaproteobacteria bacterium]|nr:MaoC family dehydratase [Alphaproteobacteria bacterium]